jgi:hypothetical protein
VHSIQKWLNGQSDDDYTGWFSMPSRMDVNGARVEEMILKN